MVQRDVALETNLVRGMWRLIQVVVAATALSD